MCASASTSTSTASKSFVSLEDIGILEAPEEVLSTMTRDGKRKWLYPIPSKGSFNRQRLILGWALIVLFVMLPVVHIGGKPAVFLDFIHREFTFFGFTFFPTDTFLLLLLLISAFLSIVIFTALFGRVWCGWGCPQTVYLEFVFRPIERWIEGKEHVRKKRNEGPWTWDKIWRRSARFTVYTLISFALANVFVSYFVGWSNLLEWMTRPPTEHWGFFLMMAATTGLILYDFGYFREQMCTIACPYARFQSVLLDADSLIVSYDPNRGEPRSRRSKKKMQQEEAGLLPAQGDCIDCFACVRTCPTGIDIRDGLQMECVACTQCIDACDEIMDKIDKPRGLIRYTSERALEDKTTRTFRPRTVIYLVLLALLLTAFTLTLSLRGSYDINVGRSAGEPFTELPDGRITNRLRFRVRNLATTPTSFTIVPVSPEGSELRIVGTTPVRLEGGEMKRLETWVLIPHSAFVESSTQEGVYKIVFQNGDTKEVTFPLLGPSQ